MEEIRDKRRLKDIIYYLVKWVGWPSECNSYEPAAHLANAPDAIATFERKLKRKYGMTTTRRLPVSELDDSVWPG